MKQAGLQDDFTDKKWTKRHVQCLLKSILKYGEKEWYLIHDYYLFLIKETGKEEKKDDSENVELGPNDIKSPN